MADANAPRPKADISDTEPHPQPSTVAGVPKVVLFNSQGQPMIRPIGFRIGR